MTRGRVGASLSATAVTTGLVVGLPAAAPAGATASAPRALLFSSDGMRPDLMEAYAAAGVMPTYAALMRQGVRGDNCLLQAFPPNTGVGWYTLATGAYPAEHGSTNNTFHRTGEGNFTNRTSFSTAGILQADTLAAAAERAGKKVAQGEWVGGRNANIAGPTVDFANFFSTRGVLTAPVVPDEQAAAAAFGRCAQLDTDTPDQRTSATLYAMRLLARRILSPNEEIHDLVQKITDAVTAHTPALLQRNGVGPDTAAALLITAGDNPTRLRSEASFAARCGVSPTEASSGKTPRLRLNRGGDRQANAAPYHIALSRLRWDPRTRGYLKRRLAEGKTRREAIRCLERYIAREIYQIIAQPPPDQPVQPSAA